MKKPIVEKQTGIAIEIPRSKVSQFLQMFESSCSLTINMLGSAKTATIEVHSTAPEIVAKVHEIAKLYA